MFKQIGAPEIILILLVLVLLFGAKKLPDLARGSGRALRIFKAETKGLMNDEDDAPAIDSKSSTPTAGPVAGTEAHQVESETKSEQQHPGA